MSGTGIDGEEYVQSATRREAVVGANSRGDIPNTLRSRFVKSEKT